MKKLISILLSVLMLMSVFSLAASAEEESLILTVANDLHYNLTYTKKATSARPLPPQ